MDRLVLAVEKRLLARGHDHEAEGERPPGPVGPEERNRPDRDTPRERQIGEVVGDQARRYLPDLAGLRREAADLGRPTPLSLLDHPRSLHFAEGSTATGRGRQLHSYSAKVARIT